MAPARKGDLTAKMAILGLLVQRADTINGIKTRLAERFPGASWSRSIAYGAVASLADEGCVRVAAAGAERGYELYEATSTGVGSFRTWLGEFSEDPPVLRDALRAKLEYVAGQEDLLAVIEAMREQEDACFEASEAAKVRLRRALRRGELGSGRGEPGAGRGEWGMGRGELGAGAGKQGFPSGGAGSAASWESRLRHALMEDEAMLWHYMGRRLQRLRQSLQDADEQFERPGGGGGIDDG